MVSPALKQALDEAKAKYGDGKEPTGKLCEYDDDDDDDDDDWYEMHHRNHSISEQLFALALRKATKNELIQILRSSLNIELQSG